MVVLGSMTLGGVINPVQDLAASLQLAFDSGAKKVLLPMSSAVDIPTVPAELFTKFQVSFYSEPVDAVYKALGKLRHTEEWITFLLMYNAILFLFNITSS
jgi:ATP-dependent Lon protease